MRKILLFLLTALLMLSASAHAYTDVLKGDDYYSAVEKLGALGVINGYEDNTFRPSDLVTREQFSKMTVCAINKATDSLAMGSYTCKFSDVPNGHWSIPYINYISSKEIIKGYADGSFGPENNINYAEASTILCRLLGYTEETVGYFWPTNYTSKADSLGLRVSYKDIYEPLNRAEIAKMFDIALFTDVNPNAKSTDIFTYGTNTSLLEAAGYKVLDECFVIATASVDSTLSSDQIKTSEGTYKLKTGAVMPQAATYGMIVLDDDDKVIISSTTPVYSMNVGISNVFGNEIEYITNSGSKGTMELDSTFETYVDYIKKDFASAASSISSGTDVTFYGIEENSWDYMVVNSLSSVTPVLASHDYSDTDTSMEGTTINKTGLIVYRNGDKATLSDISANDVVYYNTRTNIMEVYSKKITGIYYAAYPSKAYVKSVTVGGKEYTIGTVSAANSLGASSGAFEIGDKVTLLLGKNDEIVFVKSLSGFNESEYGILLSSTVQVKKTGDDAGKSEYIATVLMSDGEEYEYVTDKQYASYVGDLVKLSFEGDATKLSKINYNSNVYGEFDPTAKTLGDKTLSDNVIIFQKLTENTAEVLDIRVLSKTKLVSEQVLNIVSGNGFGDIDILYVEGLTDSAYTYGILTSTVKPTGESTRTTYNITVDGKSAQYTSDGYISVSAGPVRFKLSEGKIDTINALYKIDSAAKIEALDGTRIKLGGKTYDVDTNVLVYNKTDISKYSLLSFYELENSTVKSVTIYSNKSKSNNGTIKMIIVTY